MEGSGPRTLNHRRLPQQLVHVAASGDALAAVPRVAEHARLSRAGLHFVAVGGSAFADCVVRIDSGDSGEMNGYADTVKLMVFGNLFDERAGIVFK